MKLRAFEVPRYSDAWAYEYLYNPETETLVYRCYLTGPDGKLSATSSASQHYFSRSTWKEFLALERLDDRPCRFRKLLRKHNVERIPLK